MRAANAGQRGKDLVAGQPAFGQQSRGGGAARLGRDPDEEMLGAGEVVLQPRRLRFREVGDDLQSRREPWLRATVRLRDLADQLSRRAADFHRIRIHLAEHLRHDPLALFKERDQQVLGLNERVARLLGELLRGEHGFLGFFGVLVDVHRRLR